MSLPPTPSPMPSVFYRLTRHLWHRYANMDGVLGWLLSLSAATCAAAVVMSLGWGVVATIVTALAGGLVFFAVGETLMFLSDRYGDDNWRCAVASWSQWVLLPVDDRRYLNSLSRFHDEMRRDGRLVRRWAHSGLSSTLLVELLKAGLTDEDLRAYLNASPGSDTRASLEMLAVLSHAPAKD
jgi:hypothetical protein